VDKWEKLIKSYNVEVLQLNMKKIAVLINGLSSPIRANNFLIEWLEDLGYDVVRIEPVLSEKIDSIKYEPSVIFGWSMGGLMAPELAIKYPKAKLILAATGVKVMPNQRSARLAFEVVGTEWGMRLLGAGLRLPKSLLVNGYEQLNKIPTPGVREEYRKQMRQNINLFRKLTIEQVKYLVGYLKKVDNTELLKQLKNKTLVICGKRDRLMPISQAKKIIQLVKHSELVVSNGGHYNVIGTDELPKIKEFLE
jgi:pimeloyl-ACP methyl ester carboxylesterase